MKNSKVVVALDLEQQQWLDKMPAACSACKKIVPGDTLTGTVCDDCNSTKAKS